MTWEYYCQRRKCFDIATQDSYSGGWTVRQRRMRSRERQPTLRSTYLALARFIYITISRNHAPQY